MNATFHFSSAQEITPDIIDLIRHAYQERPVSIYIQEYDPFVPEWQIQEVRRRDAEISKNMETMNKDKEAFDAVCYMWQQRNRLSEMLSKMTKADTSI